MDFGDSRNRKFELPTMLRKQFDSNVNDKKFVQNSAKKLNTSTCRTIIFPDQSPNQILNGYPKGSMPDEYTGGVGKEGVENLRKFVEAGGTLVFLNRLFRFCH